MTTKMSEASLSCYVTFFTQGIFLLYATPQSYNIERISRNLDLNYLLSVRLVLCAAMHLTNISKCMCVAGVRVLT